MRAACALGLVVAMLAAAGCGDEGDEAQVVRGDGYQYELPEGWTNRSDDEGASGLDLGGFSPDTLVTDAPAEGFATNVNVVLESSLTDDVGAEVYADAIRQSVADPASLGGEVAETIERLNPRDIAPKRRLDLDGDAAYGFDYTGNRGRRVLRFRQVATVHDTTGYTITYTALRSRFRAGLDDLERLLDTWRWR